MVVLEDGLPDDREYRRFKIREVDGNDDFAAIEEVLTRRLTKLLVDREKPVGERGRFAYPPQLLLVDGGEGQLSVAERVLDNLGLTDEIPIASLAKHFEEVYVPGRSERVRIRARARPSTCCSGCGTRPTASPSPPPRAAGKRMTKSVLDDVPVSGRPARSAS